MVEGRPKGLPGFFAGCPGQGLHGADLCRGRREARHSQAPGGPGQCGVWELAIKSRGDAYRVVYALQIGEEIWVVHAFQKKSKQGIATPKPEIDLVRERIKRLKEQMR